MSKFSQMNHQIIHDYDSNMKLYKELDQRVVSEIKEILESTGMVVSKIESRVKGRASLIEKLEKKSGKYQSINDITDIIGVRIIPYYSDDIEKIAALVEQRFQIDWSNSIDKRKVLDLDTFGYMSLHYICSIDTNSNKDNEKFKGIRFEIQIRTVLQHVWANMYHDIGYKSGIEIPSEYIRSLNTLAGLLELADNEFNRIRREITNYRRNVETLIKSNTWDDISLNGESFKQFLELKPFDRLLKKISGINQAEIIQTPLQPYIAVLKAMKLSTLGDVRKMIEEDSDDAYRLSRHQIGVTDLDIISSALALQNLIIVRMYKWGFNDVVIAEILKYVLPESSAYSVAKMSVEILKEMKIKIMDIQNEK